MLDLFRKLSLGVVAVAAFGCSEGMGWAPLASGQRGVRGIAVDESFAYWVTNEGALRRVSLDGGAVETLVDNITNPNHIAADGTHVFWGTETGELGRVPKAGGSTEVLAMNQGSTLVGLRVDEEHMYWASQSGPVMKAQKSGETPVMLAEDHDGPSSLALASLALYWTSSGVREVSVDGGATTRIADMSFARRITTNGYHLLWVAPDEDALQVNPTSSAETIRRVTVGGNDMQVVASGLQDAIVDMVADERQIFVATMDGSVSKLPIDGGVVTVLSSGLPGGTHLAVDAFNVYWARERGESVFAFPKL